VVIGRQSDILSGHPTDRRQNDRHRPAPRATAGPVSISRLAGYPSRQGIYLGGWGETNETVGRQPVVGGAAVELVGPSGGPGGTPVAQITV